MPFATPREVGYPPSKLSARRNLELVMSHRQREILIGSILGDGYIYRQGKIQVEQSMMQKQYLFWKFAELKSLAYASPPAFIQRPDKRTGKTYGAYRFWLRQYFREWRRQFYGEDRKKVFPKNLTLTPLSLAVWYMDDGCWSGGTCTLSTESFSVRSMNVLQNQMKKQFNVSTKIRGNGKLLICAESRENFFSIIKAHVHESLLYKIS